MKFQKHNIYETLLHEACKSGIVELIKYLVSLNKFDIKAKILVSQYFVFITFQTCFFFMEF